MLKKRWMGGGRRPVTFCPPLIEHVCEVSELHMLVLHEDCSCSNCISRDRKKERMRCDRISQDIRKPFASGFFPLFPRIFLLF